MSGGLCVSVNRRVRASSASFANSTTDVRSSNVRRVRIVSAASRSSSSIKRIEFDIVPIRKRMVCEDRLQVHLALSLSLNGPIMPQSIRDFFSCPGAREQRIGRFRNGQHPQQTNCPMDFEVFSKANESFQAPPRFSRSSAASDLNSSAI